MLTEAYRQAQKLAALAALTGWREPRTRKHPGARNTAAQIRACTLCTPPLRCLRPSRRWRSWTRRRRPCSRQYWGSCASRRGRTSRMRRSGGTACCARVEGREGGGGSRGACVRLSELGSAQGLLQPSDGARLPASLPCSPVFVEARDAGAGAELHTPARILPAVRAHV